MRKSPPLSEVVASRVRELRRARGLTQEQLAEAASISRDALSRIERNDRAARLDTVAALAEALGVDAPELFALSTPRGKPLGDAGGPQLAVEAAALRSLRAMKPKVAATMVRVLTLVARS